MISFLRVAELENFTHAANDLGYSQSTVTVQIRQLEEELGYPLFDRIGKKISLTPKGEEFRKYANQIAIISQQIKSIGQENNSLCGSLRLGILESLFNWIFLPSIPEYHTQYPNILIKMKTASGDELFEKLRKNKLDLIFLLGRKLLEPDCIRAFEFPVNIIFVTAVDTPFAQQRERSFQQITKCPLILTERNSIYRKALEQVAAEHDIFLNPILEVDSTTAILSLVKMGLGISFLPEYTVHDEIARGRLTQIFVPDCSLQFWSQIFYHKSKWVTPQMMGFIHVIEKAYLVMFPGFSAQGDS